MMLGKNRYTATRIGPILAALSFSLAGPTLHTSPSFAAHPLITDDTGTQGKAGFQVEFNGMLGHDQEGKTTEKASETGTVFSYGLLGNVDAVLGVPYLRASIKDNESSLTRRGIGDVSLELKWRFYEANGLSLGFKPGMTLPSGNEKKGLGTGMPAYGPTFIITDEMAPWTFHINLGYRRNENKLSERKDIWHASLASEFEAFKGFKLVSNIGVERNTDRTSNIHPAFAIAGVIYSVTEGIDLNFGVQFGLNKTETDYTIHPGIVFKFNLK